MGSWRIVVVTPDGASDVVASKTSSNAALAGNATVRNNGAYQVRLEQRWLLSLGTWTRKSTSTFNMRAPAARPAGLRASASGGKLTVRWNRGLEDDLTGYTVAASGLGTKSGSPGGLCSGTACSATFNVPAAAAGRATVSVRASRSNGSGGSVSSVASSVSVAFGSGPGGGPGGLAPGTPVPGLPLPGSGALPGSVPLTPLNQNPPVTLPTVAPDGSTPGFTYPTPDPVVASNLAPNKPQAAVDTAGLQWGKSVAIALILLVVAAHLGTWTRRLRVAQARLSSKGTAARTARAGSGRARVRRSRERIARAEATATTISLPKPAAGAAKKGARRADTPSAASRSQSLRGPATRTRPGTKAGVAAKDAPKASGRHGSRHRTK
ncbi:hypothetical protein [Actinomadura craniellae]|uniref:hypothetical protein n=1 Tax=Actinomadura craniellae TaxID=2231787 RepID=UPI00131454A6|nr:hypothetical protein [Actinomadura craniellae]